MIITLAVMMKTVKTPSTKLGNNMSKLKLEKFGMDHLLAIFLSFTKVIKD